MRKLTAIAALIATLSACGGCGDVETPAAAFVLTDADQDAVKVHYRDPSFATKLFENWTVSKCVNNKKPKVELDRQVVSAGIFGHPLFTAANHVLEFRLRVIEQKRETLTKLAQKFRKFGKETIPTVMRELDDIPRRSTAAFPLPIPINASPVDMVDLTSEQVRALIGVDGSFTLTGTIPLGRGVGLVHRNLRRRSHSGNLHREEPQAMPETTTSAWTGWACAL